MPLEKGSFSRLGNRRTINHSVGLSGIMAEIVGVVIAQKVLLFTRQGKVVVLAMCVFFR